MSSYTGMFIYGRHIRTNDHIRDDHIRPYMIIYGPVYNNRTKSYMIIIYGHIRMCTCFRI